MQITTKGQTGFTLVEVAMALALGVGLVAILVSGYTMGFNRSEWTSYSLAAQANAIQRMEQTRVAQWKPLIAVDQLTEANFQGAEQTLSLPLSQTKCSNHVSITTISTAPLLRMIQVDCIWWFTNSISKRTAPYTNTVVTIRAPDL